MKSVCLSFQVHQPVMYRRYRFFDIGNDDYYYDDYTNETNLRKVAEKSYLPANKLMLKLASKFKNQFKLAFSISGTTLDQLAIYAPEVIDSFRELTQTGCVEFLAETGSHSLSSLINNSAFENDVKRHEQKIKHLFGQTPKIFRNTEMIYADEIGSRIAAMGYKAILTEGAGHVLGWKSPDFLYVNAINPRLKVFMRNFKLSDDISFRFSNKNWSEYPLTAEKFMGWLDQLGRKEELINLFLNYESLGIRQKKENGIFDFMEFLIKNIIGHKAYKMATPSEAVREIQPVSVVSVPHPVSWADEERDLTPWLGNEMQKEAFDKLYELNDRMMKCTDSKLNQDWNILQMSDHFRYMSTKYFAGVYNEASLNPFDSPYEAFINYMNILSDFKIRLGAVTPEEKPGEDAASLHRIIDEKDKKIKKMEAELMRWRKAEMKKSEIKKKPPQQKKTR